MCLPYLPLDLALFKIIFTFSALLLKSAAILLTVSPLYVYTQIKNSVSAVQGRFICSLLRCHCSALTAGTQSGQYLVTLEAALNSLPHTAHIIEYIQASFLFLNLVTLFATDFSFRDKRFAICFKLTLPQAAIRYSISLAVQFLLIFNAPIVATPPRAVNFRKLAFFTTVNANKRSELLIDGRMFAMPDL